LADVARLVAGGSDLRAVLERRRAELEDTRALIDRKLMALDIRVADAGPDVVVRRVESQLIAGLRAGVVPGEDVGALFYELESVVRDARAHAPLPPGMLVPLQRSVHGQEIEVFVPVTRRVDQGRVVSRRLPAAQVAAVIRRGSYQGMPALRQAFEEWVVAAGHDPGDRVRVLYLQFGAEPELEVPTAFLAEGSRDYVTEIQIPLVAA